MPEFSNLLRQRLGAVKAGTGAHPDADTLAAYSERMLPAAERQQIIAHLVECAECREVIVLSQPMTPELEQQPVFTPAPVSRWRRFFTPSMGLAGSLAAMAVIAVVILQVQKPTQQFKQAEKEAKAAPPVLDQKPSSGEPASANPQPPLVSSSAQPSGSRPSSVQPAPAFAPPSSVQPSESRFIASGDEALARQSNKDKTAAAGLNVTGLNVNGAVVAHIAPAERSDAAAKPAASAPPALLAGNLAKRDFVNNGIFVNRNDNAEFDGQNSNDLPTAPLPQPGAMVSIATSNGPGKPTQFPDIPAEATEKKSTVLVLTPAPAPQHEWMLSKITKGAATRLRSTISPAIRSKSLGDSTMGAPGMFAAGLKNDQPTDVASAPAKSEAGLLETTNAFSIQSKARAGKQSLLMWKVAGGKLLKSSDQFQWQEAYPAAMAGFDFSFVSARGGDIWAGGSQARLIRSRDGGSTWENVKLGDSATGNVVSIVAGSLSVQVRTSDNQLWSSADGGKTWTLRTE